MNKEEVMKLALEALERTVDCGHDAHECANVRAINAIRAALAEEALQRLTDVSQEIEAELAEPEQEPLTEEEIYDIWEKKVPFIEEGGDWFQIFARAIEQAHGIKGEA